VCAKLGGAILSNKTELEEIGHTGGKVTFDVKIDAQGGVSYSVGWSHSRPTPATVFAVYAIPQGVAVGDIRLGGIGMPCNPPRCPIAFWCSFHQTALGCSAISAQLAKATGEQAIVGSSAPTVLTKPRGVITS
jgi:hypothetical protein